MNGALVALVWTAAVVFVVIMWFAVLPTWYFLTFVVFGVFMIPFRIIRRGQRRRQHLQEVQLATMQAMMLQQQAALRSRESRPES